MGNTECIERIMSGFARRSGLQPPLETPRRYLWTDAFAVCNFLELFRKTKDESHLQTARDLVEQVHHILGKHRPDDPRRGWISGLEETEGERHPTRGGLRIGKERNERASGEPFDERAEWDRDGQYYHYLTKWMHALDRVARFTGESRYLDWAVELAKVSHERFSYIPYPGANKKRLYWKMSSDLSRPLVPSMGQHDPLDGLITYRQLQEHRTGTGETPASLDLADDISEMAAICEGTSWRTADALGIGGLLTDACRLLQLIVHADRPESGLMTELLTDATVSLGAWLQGNPIQYPAAHRLAFRELGLSIGLHAVEAMQSTIRNNPDKPANIRMYETALASLARFLPLAGAIEEFWLKPENQIAESWTAHREINCVMLATSLGPAAYLMLD